MTEEQARAREERVASRVHSAVRWVTLWAVLVMISVGLTLWGTVRARDETCHALTDYTLSLGNELNASQQQITSFNQRFREDSTVC